MLPFLSKDYSVNSPVTSNYHLEIALNSENYAKWLAKLFAKYKNSNIEPKITQRRDEYVIYFKKSDQISNFLIMIGAVSSCLDFEDVRANRDLMNNANRLTNMDTANMKRTIETGSRQAEEIALIDQILGLLISRNRRIPATVSSRVSGAQSPIFSLLECFFLQKISFSAWLP